MVALQYSITVTLVLIGVSILTGRLASAYDNFELQFIAEAGSLFWLGLFLVQSLLALRLFL